MRFRDALDGIRENAQPMDKFRLWYFHRNILLEWEYNFDYKRWILCFVWRFSLWLGFKCYHIRWKYIVKLPTLRRKHE